ncbi:hypothetical protein [Capnocytophaga catalasegens]|uniref:hypothetical protein n=1 Tax=Capnocytophaga catalasegens TaxID=1004260 RepID=UPI0022310BF4|nr:hypothetical protein [Capnocytophaga catalasegens]
MKIHFGSSRKAFARLKTRFGTNFDSFFLFFRDFSPFIFYFTLASTSLSVTNSLFASPKLTIGIG